MSRTLRRKKAKESFYRKNIEKSDRLNIFILTFATLIKNSR